MCFDGAVLTKTLTALFTASAPEQLLSKTAGHIGIRFINTEGKEKRGREGGRGHVGMETE